jgi:3'(2'), 5'-bisphosphate nucleotidase
LKEALERILRDCGALLAALSEEQRKGQWEGEQFKARADRIAHDFLARALGQTLPVVSEEDADSIRLRPAKYWLIDPIDGTASFAHGFPGWVTQAALMQNEEPVLSGIFAPVTGEYFTAEKGKGAERNAATLRVSSSDAIESIVDNYPEPRGVTREIMEGLGISRYVESGSIALKICRVADGTADVFYKAMNPRDWDLAAPDLILSEAGGILTDAFGEPVRYGMNGRLHNGLIAARTRQQTRAIAEWHKRKFS